MKLGLEMKTPSGCCLEGHSPLWKRPFVMCQLMEIQAELSRLVPSGKIDELLECHPGFTHCCIVRNLVVYSIESTLVSTPKFSMVNDKMF